MPIVKTEEHSLVRDTGNMALLETDTKVRDDYISKKRLLIENRKLKERMDNLEQMINTLMQNNKVNS